MQNETALMPLSADMAELTQIEAAKVPDRRDAPPKRVPRNLSNLEKAAVVVRFLLNEGADIPLEELPVDLQTRLTQQMGRMGLVDRVTLDAVVQEFAEALDGIGLAFPHGLAGALDAMDGKIAASAAERLRREAGVRRIGDPWTRLRGLDAAELAEIAQGESTEVAAVLLSKLDTPLAAEMLGKLSGPVARRITYAISRTGSVTPDAVDRIGWSLAAQLDAKPVAAFADGPEKRVGDILNQSAAATRDDVLTALDAQDEEFASSVRKTLFTYSDIALRVKPRDVPAIVRVIEQDTLVIALAASTDETEAASAEFLLGHMSTRMADNLREEIEENGPVKRADGEAAMTAVVSAIRALETDAILELVARDEDEAT